MFSPKDHQTIVAAPYHSGVLGNDSLGDARRAKRFALLGWMVLKEVLELLALEVELVVL